MSAPGQAYLGAIRLQAQQRADMVNSNMVSLNEWNSYATNSYKELYDLLVSAYGNEYYVQTPFPIIADGINYLFALPNDFYKLLGVDYSVPGGGPNQSITLQRFNFANRNLNTVINTAMVSPQAVKYRIHGNGIWFSPTPMSGSQFNAWYIPQPTNLQSTFTSSFANSSSVMNVADTSLLLVGMSVFGPGVQLGSTITAITSNVSATLSLPTTSSALNQIYYAWNDATQINGISGWEEYIITDMAIKGMQKEESDVSVLAAQKLDLRARINDMGANRDAGSPMTVSDVYGNPNGYDNGGFNR